MRFSSKLWRQECSISIILKSFKRRTHVDEISDDQITCHQRGLTKLCLDPKFYTYLAQLFMKPCIRPTVKFGFYRLLKMGQIPSSFCLFSSFCSLQFQHYKFKKHRWCAWDSNLWSQDGRRRLNHGAIAAAPIFYRFQLWWKNSIVQNREEERPFWRKDQAQEWGLFSIPNTSSVTRLGDLLHFGQLFKAFGNNIFTQISYILWQFL